MNEVAALRVVVVDDHTVMRAGVVALLAGEDGIEIVGEAGDGRAALDLVERHDPDVALVDLRMPVLDGVTTTTEIVARHPRTRVLILTTYDTDADIERGVEAGAIGYLLKDTTREQLRRRDPGGGARGDGARAPGGSEAGGQAAAPGPGGADRPGDGRPRRGRRRADQRRDR